MEIRYEIEQGQPIWPSPIRLTHNPIRQAALL
jgi:hypothetical protein